MFDRDFGMGDFEKWVPGQLRKIYEGMQGQLDELLAPYRPKPERPEETTGAQQGPRGSWSSQELFATIHDVARTGKFVASPPDDFDFSAFFPVCSRLEKLTRDGREHGRVATVNVLTRQIRFGPTAHGDEYSVQIPIAVSPVEVACMTVHSHPTSSDARNSYHFSAEDICSFLRLESLQLQVVVAEGLTLIAMRTNKTPALDGALERRIQDLCEKKRTAIFEGEPGRRASIFTKEVCKMLDLPLYRIKHSDGTMIAKRVLT